MKIDEAIETLQRLLTLTADDFNNMLFSDYIQYSDAVGMAVDALKRIANMKEMSN